MQKFVVFLVAIFISGGVYSQHQGVYSEMEIPTTYCEKIKTPNGDHLLVRKSDRSANIGVFYSLKETGELELIESMPTSGDADKGDTLYVVRNLFKVENGFIVVGYRSRWGSGGGMVRSFVEQYNWSYELVRVLDLPELDEIGFGSLSVMNDGKIYATGLEAIYQSGFYEYNKDDFFLFEISLDEQSLKRTVITSDEGLDYNPGSMRHWSYYSYFPQSNKVYVPNTAPTFGVENHLFQFDFNQAHLSYSDVQGELFDGTNFGPMKYSVVPIEFESQNRMLLVSDLPIIEGSFEEVNYDGSELYFSVIDENLEVIHSVKYTDPIFGFFNPHYFKDMSIDYSFDSTTIEIAYTYSQNNWSPDLHPITGDTLWNSFIIAEFDTQSGETQNLWQIERDSVIENDEDYFVEHHLGFFFRNNESYHFLLDTDIDHATRKSGILTLTKSDMNLGQAEFKTGQQLPVLFPNPSSDFVQIGNIWNTRYSITDFVGRKVMEGKIGEQNSRIDIRNLKAGDYILILENGVASKRLKKLK